MGEKKQEANLELLGLAWNDVKVSPPFPWFSGLAILLEVVEATGLWPPGL